MEKFERHATLTGIGQSEIGRRLGRDPLELTLEGCIAAIQDAGLSAKDIDGRASPGPA
jgi:3-oxoacyl-[acyl-carrier-protein] synthase III